MSPTSSPTSPPTSHLTSHSPTSHFFANLWNSRPGQEFLLVPKLCLRKRLRSAVARRHDARALDHEDHRPLRRPRAVDDSLGHHEALARRQLDGAALQVDQEPSLQDVEELILIVVLVPVVLALNDAEPDHRVVDPAE